MVRRTLVAVLLGVLVAPATASASACTKAWDGGAGTTRFSDADNWAGNTLPTATDHICVSVATSDSELEVDGEPTVRVIDSAEPLRITGTLTVTDAGGTVDADEVGGHRQAHRRGVPVADRWLRAAGRDGRGIRVGDHGRRREQRGGVGCGAGLVGGGFVGVDVRASRSRVMTARGSSTGAR